MWEDLEPLLPSWYDDPDASAPGHEDLKADLVDHATRTGTVDPLRYLHADLRAAVEISGRASIIRILASSVALCWSTAFYMQVLVDLS